VYAVAFYVLIKSAFVGKKDLKRGVVALAIIYAHAL
jgi:hypothetical protein